MGDVVQWYFDLFEGDLFEGDLFGGGEEPQRANDAVERLTGTPAESVAQWAARNKTLFE